MATNLANSTQSTHLAYSGQTRRHNPTHTTQSHYSALVIHADQIGTTAPIVSLEITTPLTLHTTLINGATGEFLHHKDIRINQPTTLYFHMSKKFPGWYYLLKYSHHFQRFGCSCLENVNYAACNHQSDIEEYVGLVAIA